MNEAEQVLARKPWPDNRAIWRWHFYAGLFCIPFVTILACSGSIYLFKPQIEAWIDRHYDNVDENARFLKVLFRLHGELLMGNRGSALVELAASWTIIMIVTGLFLWWPRKAKALGGIRIVATVRPLALLPPVVIEPPASGSDDWTAKSMTPNRPRRVDLVVDGKTGEIKDRKDFKDRHLVERIVGTGIAAHEGQLFGWPNQLLGLVTATGLVLLSVSSVVMWWRRREPGLGATATAARPRFSLGLVILVVVFGIYLPLFGASLIAVLLLEWALLRRIPGIRDWLGLRRPVAESVAAGVAA